MYVYVGAYTESPLGHAAGIEVFRFDAETGELHPVQTVAGVANPSFLAFDANQRRLYAVNELDEGEISAFARDAESGELRPLNRQPVRGAAPCYVSFDPSGRYALTANYSGGNVTVLPVDREGQLGPAVGVVAHEGSSIRPEQEGPHPHMIAPTPDEAYLVVTDLGVDGVFVYQLDEATGQLTPNTQGRPFVPAEPGSGPRHFVFSPDGRWLYVINELASTLTVYAYDGARGELRPRQTVSTLPEGVDGLQIQNSCAHVAVSPDGRFVYGSNRGHDSIAIWAVDAQGALSPVGHQSTLGRTPRNFSLDPSGAWLLAANEDTDTVVTFRRHPDTGTLTPTGAVTHTPSPVAVLFSRE